MCGICGFWSTGPHDGPPWSQALDRMTDALAHRGPNDRGTWLERVGERVVALGHRRLSIIDLSEAGRQPMTDDRDPAVVLSFNGEIYNFAALRAELEAKGYVFRSRTDSEVILHGYREHGLDVFRRLDGMFAIALWDGARRELVLARDPFGKKPLYYWSAGGDFAFASEPAALIQHPRFEPRLARGALDTFLFYGYFPAPFSVFDRVRKLLPGHYLVVGESGEARESAYFRPVLHAAGAAPSWPEAMERFDSLLRAAVRKRLMSDVPLGVFLSGGVDSATVASIAREESAIPLTTFSLGFREADFDELPRARESARFLRMENVCATADTHELASVAEQLPAICSEPLADSSVVPVYLLSRLTREHVTVALGGDGADELLAGYPTYPLQRVLAAYRALPSPLHRLVAAVARAWPPSFGNYNVENGLKKFVAGVPYPPARAQYVWMAYVQPRELPSILVEPALSDDELFAPLTDTLARGDARNDVERAIHLNLAVYLPDSILAKVDRASMRWGLEVRAPFLDKQLAEFLLALPSSMKLEGLRGKRLLRRAMTGRIPEDVRTQRKRGFTPPVARWINDDLRALADDLLAPAEVRRGGLLDERGVTRLLAEHRARSADHWRTIWALMVFQLWYRHYFVNAPWRNAR